MKIPDPIYDQYYFSSGKNQEEILKVVENYKHDLINFLLDTVMEEINEYKKRVGYPSGFGEIAVRADSSRDTADYISTIINNLKVK